MKVVNVTDVTFVALSNIFVVSELLGGRQQAVLDTY
jgi:hypothetical protein